MRLLLDTHIFLWYIVDDVKLPSTFRLAIQDPNNEVFLSVASIWESVIKHQIGKLSFPFPPAEWLPKQRAAHGIGMIVIDEGAMSQLASLPQIHRDPFDRLIVAQAMQHSLAIVTVDPEILAYQINVLAAT